MFPYRNTSNSSSNKRTYEVANENPQEMVPQVDTNKDDENELRRRKRAMTSESFGPDFLTYYLENEPLTLREAMSTPKAPFWKVIKQ